MSSVASEKQKHERIYVWDNFKALLIFLVVLGHFIIPIAGNGKLLNTAFCYIELFHMPAFIFVSGYFSKSYIKKPFKQQFSTVVAYFVFYVFLKLLIQLLSLLLGNGFHFSLLSESGAPWYMLAVAIWLITLPFFSQLPAWLAISISVFLALISGLYSSVNYFLSFSRVFTFLPFFITGYFFKYKRPKHNRIVKAVCSVFLLFTISLFYYFRDPIKALFLPFFYGDKPYANSWNGPKLQALEIQFVIFIAAFMITLAVLYLLPDKKTIFSVIGERTLSVYFLHRLIRDVYSHFLLEYIVLYSGTIQFIIAIIISLIVTIVSSIYIFSKPFMAVFKYDYSVIFKSKK